MTDQSEQAPITLTTLRDMKHSGQRITCLTAYDASFARLLEAAGIEVLLVGDSLGMVIQGHDSTLPVSVEDMIYHTRAVRRGAQRPLLVADMPFMADASPAQALDSAARLMKEGGAHVVKIEGGAVMLDTVNLLSARGIPVCAHLGLQPQSVHKLGGYRVQGRDDSAAARIMNDARQLAAAGAEMLVLECVPSVLAQEITTILDIPVIGIGAGAACDGQVLVLYDMLGITAGKRPRFVRDFLSGAPSALAAVQAYIRAVKHGEFPAPEHGFS